MTQRSYRFRAMGSPCELRLCGDDPEQLERAAEGSRQELERLERKYSRYRDDSLTTAINRNAGRPEGQDLDPETAALLDYADTCWQQSEGRCDITSGALREVWDFRSGRVPDASEVSSVLERVGWGKLRWERPRLLLPAGMELDFGGIVKEYAADRVAELCRTRGIVHGMVDLGGDLAAVGPHPDGSPWSVGIRHPQRAGATLATVPLEAGGLASSGDYERGFELDGVRYGHILDPRTGWPAQGLVCVLPAA